MGVRQFLNSTNLLATIETDAQKNSRDAMELKSLSKEALNWKPSPTDWSIAECLEHLAMAGAAFQPIFNAALARGRRRFPVNTAPVYRPTWLGALLIRKVLPEAPGKLTAPRIFRPSAPSALDGSIEHFLREQENFIKLVRQTKGVDYNKIRLRSPVTPLVRYSLADAFVVIVVHAQRHLLQAQRVRNAPGFPGESVSAIS